MRNNKKGNKRRIDRTAEREAIRTEELIAATKAETRTATVQRIDKKRITRRKLSSVGEKPKREKRGAYRISLEDLSKGNEGYVNALYTHQKDIETSMSAHVAFRHKIFGDIIPVVIPTSYLRQPSKKLKKNDIGDWVKENVPNWENITWYFSRIGHVNIISDKPLDTKKFFGYALISSKKVEQNTRKGGKVYYFPHVIILETRDRPAFWLVADNKKGEDMPKEVHIGPTIGALQDGTEVREYLHLKPYK